MTQTMPNHYSHSFALNLEKIPTKKSDRIALQILYPGIIFGLFLVLLGVFELLNSFKDNSTDFDFIPENNEVIYPPFLNPTFFDIVIILIGSGIVISLLFSYIRYKKIFFDGKKVQIIYRPVFGAKKVVKERYDWIKDFKTKKQYRIFIARAHVSQLKLTNGDLLVYDFICENKKFVNCAVL